MDNVKRKYYEALGIPNLLFDSNAGKPITIDQANRIIAIASIEDLDASDYQLIQENPFAASAYYRHLEEVDGFNNESHPSGLADIIELFPARKLIGSTIPSALAASSAEDERQSDESIYSIPTNQQDVRLKFEFRTNPMSLDVTVRMKLDIDEPCEEAIAIAWKPKSQNQAILECQLEAGSNNAVATRVFTQEQWQSLKSLAFEFGEISSD